MHPALSVIFFTVVSGSGFGLFILLVLMDLFGLGGGLSLGQVLGAGITALVLTTAGLISSVGHLANPKNAWRAMFRWRTSWLAREGVLAVAFYPVAMLYLGLAWLNGSTDGGWVKLVGGTAGVLAVATVFSTGMIYACLKTIRQWNTSLTPANYLAMGLALGAVIMTVVRDGDEFSVSLAVALIAVAALMKAIYYFWIGKPQGPSINTATGFNRGTVRLLDVGHTAGTFLTKEFGYQVAPCRVRMLRIAVFLFGFILPAFLLSFLTPLAIASAFLGIGLERWLFFAEARHVVNLYHGLQRT